LRCVKSRLLVVVNHKSLMGGLRSFPTRDLFKMHLTHAPHHVNYVELTLNSQDFSLLPV